MSRSQTPRDGRKKCRRCAEGRPEALTRHGLCYECTLARRGRNRMELHHPFGRHNATVEQIAIDIPANWHRVLDALRAQRPEVLKRSGDNPLHQIAAIVTTLGEAAEAFGDYARRAQWPEWSASLADIFARAAECAADWLLILAAQLNEGLGTTWAETLGMPPLWHA